MTCTKINGFSMTILPDILSSSSFIPHGHCYLWRTPLVGLHVISDSLIVFAYFSIPATLFYFVRKRKDLPYVNVFILFGAFIIACGLTHLMAIVTLWYPIYWVSGMIKAITAFISVVTATAIIPLVPQALTLKSPTELERINKALERAHQQLTFHIENTPLAVIEWDNDFRVQRWSKQAETIFGWNPEEVMNLHPSQWNFVVPEDVEAVRNIMVSLLDRSQPRNLIRNRNYTKNGSIVYCDWYNSALFDESGQLVSILSLVQDVTDEIEAQKALLESEQRYQTLAETSPVGIFRTDEEGNCLYVNEKWSKITGMNASEALGEGWVKALYPKDLERIFEEWKIALSQKTSFQSEYRMQRPTGEVSWVFGQAIAQRNDLGEIIGYVGTVTDITARKQAEEALQNSEAKFRQLAQQEELINRIASQIRNSLDLDTILQTTVAQIKDLLQLDRCHFVWYRSQHTSNHPKLQAHSNLHCPKQTSFLDYWEVVYEAKNLELPSLLGCYSVEDVGSWAMRYLQLEMIQVYDTSLISEPEMRQTLMQFNCLSYLSIPVETQLGEIGIICCLHHQKTHRWNQNEIELLKAVTDQLAIAINQAQLYAQTQANATQAQAQAQQLEVALQQLQQTQTQLIQTEKMSSLGQMVAGIAHEINNPVTFVYSNVIPAIDYTNDLLNLLSLYQEYYPQPFPEIQQQIDEIELEFIQEDLPKLLNSMKLGADRIRQIVVSLRSFSRLDEAEFKAVDLHQGIDSTLLILQNRLKDQAGQVGIEVIKKYGHLPLVECYAGQMNQVFMNILVNAIDALNEENIQRRNCRSSDLDCQDDLCSKKPMIEIQTEVVNSNWVMIRIADNGPGISQQVRNKLFDPFFTTKPIGRGTGLGLSISYQIVVEKHQGQLECYSEVGEGSEFIIQIPIRQATASRKR
ncbi:MAG: PAS domain S-box protein [Lyngbya sp.]|nr:PAS domain S-box protein [Lyngbya sp.]